MKKFIVVMLFLLAGQSIFAQSGWMKINSFAPYDFRLVEFATLDTVYLSGGFNLLYKSTNKGQTWEIKTHNIEEQFVYGLYLKFFDGRNGILNTSRNIIATTNGGNSFTTLYTASYIQNAAFINMNTGYITVDNLLIKTTNHGVSWISRPLESEWYVNMIFTDENTGYANVRDSNKLVRTTDGGFNWSKVKSTFLVQDFKSNGAGTLLLVENKAIYKSTNSGNNWTQIFSSSQYIEKIFIAAPNKWLIPYTLSKFLITTDAGVTWNYKDVPYSSNLCAGFNANGEGVSAKNEGKIYTISPDITITEINADKIQKLSDFEMTNGTNLFAIGDPNSISKSSDGGNTFVKKYLNFTPTSISFLNSQTGYATLDNKVLKTTNSSVSWDTIYRVGSQPSNYLRIRDVNFINNSSAYFWSGFNYDDTLCISSDAGMSWNKSNLIAFTRTIVPGYTQEKKVLDLKIFGSGVGYCAVNGSYNIPNQILKTTNYGLNWFDVTNNLSAIPRLRVKFIDENSGYAISNTSEYYKTINGGQNWIALGAVNSNISQYGDFTFINGNTGFATYYLGYTNSIQIVTKTTNGGITWRDININTDYSPMNLTNINFINELTGFVYGNYGTIFKTTDGGFVFVNQTSSEVPEKFNLKQNYPNPFNPSTKINYEIKSGGFVSLKVFDLLGKEVATLVNEKQNAGRYVVDFNSTEFNLPSGVYFYTLSAGEYKETKKMVLVK